MNVWKAPWRSGIEMREMTAGTYSGEFEDFEILSPEEYLEKLSFSRNLPDYSFELKQCMEIAMQDFTDREKYILELYFYDQRTLREIGKELYLPVERVLQIKDKLLRRLRHPSRINQLENMSFFI